MCVRLAQIDLKYGMRFAVGQREGTLTAAGMAAGSAWARLSAGYEPTD